MERTVLHNYAEALYDAAAERGELETARTALAQLAAVMQAEPKLERIAEHPGIADDRKLALLGEALGEARTPLLEDFLRLVLQRGRLPEVAAMSDAFERVIEARSGRLPATVESCLPLSPEQVARLEQALGALKGTPVRVSTRVVPELLGGLRVQVDSEVLDESIAGRLQRLGEHLTGRLS